MWSYDATNLSTDTAAGRLNTVRLLVGDTQNLDQQLQDEEITFALTEGNNSVYLAAAFCCRLLASKYSRMVNSQLDGALQAEYSDRVKNYNTLYIQMMEFAKGKSGKLLAAYAGGISKNAMDVVEANTDRVQPAFKIGQFDNPGAGSNYIPDYE